MASRKNDPESGAALDTNQNDTDCNERYSNEMDKEANGVASYNSKGDPFGDESNSEVNYRTMQ